MSYLRNLAAALATAAFLSSGACVTINVYFPAAAAEQAADKIIEEVWGDDADKTANEQSSDAGSLGAIPSRVAYAILEWLVSAARAQEANLDISSPAIGKLQASMRARHGQLLPHYNSGAVGLTGNGLVAVRDAKAIPLAARKTVNQLVADENRDRMALYREIAAANGHPEWERQIQETFARRWIDRAQRGWYYQSGGGWRAK
ncbi:MAG: DUF1318 domain-containing protein [Gammaproteobacteria bacterium]|nr:DUF1318 domain-containing protein [Gammaproteobacteria bacterium]NIM72847.1 DUF1318 domain-containing protein [Gammaproteobacteria bacterium]NIN38305.1 DUF1318 domain-containing protein [Gammaproteobacteria bacterium]NIO24595.1 DUF1318 domain-containing protein [Gammaproteobacteria bacterium]NIO65204.1 DUF1318 domain-containing protein [Gammaproteobacteria bacterium]